MQLATLLLATVVIWIQTSANHKWNNVAAGMMTGYEQKPTGQLIEEKPIGSNLSSAELVALQTMSGCQSY